MCYVLLPDLVALPDILPGGSKGVSFRSSQVAESYDVGTDGSTWSADYRLWTGRLGRSESGLAPPAAEGQHYKKRHEPWTQRGRATP